MFYNIKAKILTYTTEVAIERLGNLFRILRHNSIYILHCALPVNRRSTYNKDLNTSQYSLGLSDDLSLFL